MIHLCLDELVHAIRLKLPDIGIYTGNLIKCMIIFLPAARYGSKLGNFLLFSPQVMNWMVN